MRSYVLDTHACVYALAAPAKLGRKATAALRAVEAGRAIGWIPAAVLAEVVLLHERARIDVGLSEIRAAMAATPGLRYLPLDFRQLEEFAEHRQIPELFDRLILAAARAVNAKLITKDSLLSDSPLVEAVWS